MTKNILLVGVGGQGIILASKILTIGLIELGYDVKMSEIHGMSQRGGSVTTQIKYGEKVNAPNIGLGEADLIVSFEKVEALRALPYLKKGGTVVTDDCEIYPAPVLTGAEEYPSDAIDFLKSVVDDVRVIPADKMAASIGNKKVQNICLLGALVKSLGLENVDWRSIVEQNVPKKAVEPNLKAFDKGFASV